MEPPSLRVGSRLLALVNGVLSPTRPLVPPSCLCKGPQGSCRHVYFLGQRGGHVPCCALLVTPRLSSAEGRGAPREPQGRTLSPLSTSPPLRTAHHPVTPRRTQQQDQRPPQPLQPFTATACEHCCREEMHEKDTAWERRAAGRLPPGRGHHTERSRTTPALRKAQGTRGTAFGSSFHFILVFFFFFV